MPKGVYEHKKGKKHSKEAKIKISKNHAKTKYWLGKYGKDSPNWKGGIRVKGVHSEIIRRFGRDPKEVFRKDNWNCQRCGSKDDLTIHHIDGQGRNSKNPNNDINNLITLCRKCHSSIHGKKNRKWGEINND